MASQPSSWDRFSVAALTVHSAQSDLLEVDPLDLGPDAPATAALEVEHGPQPGDVRQRGEYLAGRIPDSSALVRLIAIEAETAALRQELRRWPDRTPSRMPSRSRRYFGSSLKYTDATVNMSQHAEWCFGGAPRRRMGASASGTWRVDVPGRHGRRGGEARDP
jgi:hypothetical protein